MKARFLILSILLLSCLQVFSQQDTVKLTAIVAKANEVAQGRPIEKVYLQFDKPYYAIGDTIWFKASLTFGLHQPSELSKILYVDVISSRDSLVKTLMLSVKDGTSVGSIALTQPKFKQDNYHIKAYTKWMLNFEQAYFFNKTISVGKAFDKEITTNVSLKRIVSNNVQKISADIIFKDGDGNPYANKKVDWNVAAGLFVAIDDGKGITNQNGLLTVSFANTKSADLSKAILTTTLDAGKNKIYDHIFPLKSVAAATDVQFFPEGGNLINDVPIKVAIKAVQSNGLGAGFTATIIDNAGNTMGTCDAQHAGMGVFTLTPQAGKSYKANVDFKDGSKGTYDLPKAQASGMTFAVNIVDTMIVVKFMADPAYLKSHLNDKYYLLGRSGQTMCYAATTVLSNVSYTASIPSSRFPSGIAQFTLMTVFGQPISERVAFIRHQDQLNVTMSSDKNSYAPRQRVQLNLLAKDKLTPVEADLSISVIDESKVPFDENSETTILTSLLLTSDLKGYIENPNYYFREINAQVVSDLDLLMLTQGYRRFTYQDMLTGNIKDAEYLPEQGIEITGTLRAGNGMPVKSGRVTLQIPDRYFRVEKITDAEGRFKFDNLVFTDSVKMVVDAKNNLNSKTMMVMVDGAAFPTVDKNPSYADEDLNIDTKLSTYFQNARKIYDNLHVLKEVVITAKTVTKGPSFADHASLSSLSAMNAKTIEGERLSACNDVLGCLKTLAIGTTFDVSTNSFYVNAEYNAGARIPMAVSVGGMFVEVSHLSSLNPRDIASVEVFLKDDLGLVDKVNNTRGVLVVNMKPNVPMPEGTKIAMYQLQDMIGQPSVVKLTPLGYYVMSKQFYSPKYTPGNTSYGPDLRTTIYWNPRLASDKTGKASVEFFTAESRGNYRAVVEGLDKDGNIAYSVYRFKVE